MTGPAVSVWIGHDLPPIWRDGIEYFLLSVDGELYLAPNRCPHRGGPLKFGRLDAAGDLICPMHGGAFSIASLLANPDTLRLTAVR
ncbi:Rieske (2Fe-2S) protein [Phenylobacterium sp.]|uniref:Rieske (2Fe-2S) protein n=1 Tax=Phenylobacterium sp. TaxID=1871053 RepID=UPI00286A0F08|nr:Rieske (2Fe-2S) protein [Phenylobacterium sp.]